MHATEDVGIWPATLARTAIQATRVKRKQRSQVLPIMALTSSTIWFTLALGAVPWVGASYQASVSSLGNTASSLVPEEGPNWAGSAARESQFNLVDRIGNSKTRGTRPTQPPDRCDRMVAHLRKMERRVRELDIRNHLTGQWVSSQCEVRPGPQYVLRQYIFGSDIQHSLSGLKMSIPNENAVPFGNQSFVLNQFHYSDRDCSQPLYLVTAWGQLAHEGASWLVPGSTEMRPKFQRVGIVPYTKEAAAELERRTTRSCSFLHDMFANASRWRPGKLLIVYWSDLPERQEAPMSQSGKQWISHFRDDTCLNSIHLDYHELALMRIERRRLHHKHPSHHEGRPSSSQTVAKTDEEGSDLNTGPKVSHRDELLLGDIHSDLGSRMKYRPTALQPYPLKRANKIIQGCKTCHKITHSSRDNPPRLHPRPYLAVQPEGEWISLRCETRPNMLFLKRRLRFHHDRTWEGSYTYYSDERCSRSVFDILARGRFLQRGLSSLVDGGTDFEFKIKEAAITPQTKALAQQLNAVPNRTCGVAGQWQMGSSQDITLTHGCKAMGLKIPLIERDLLKMELGTASSNPRLHLHLGQTDTDQRSSPLKRPTSYQPALVQCQSDPGFHIATNELSPMALGLQSMARSRASKVGGHQSQMNTTWGILTALAVVRSRILMSMQP